MEKLNTRDKAYRQMNAIKDELQCFWSIVALLSETGVQQKH